MEITRSKLKRIIKEEYNKTLQEMPRYGGQYADMDGEEEAQGNYDDHSDQLVREILTVVGGLLKKFGEKDMHPEVLDGLIQIQNITNG